MDIFDYAKNNKKSDLKSFCSQELNSEQPSQKTYSGAKDTKNIESKIDPNTLKTATEMYNKYKNLSKEDLQQEFLDESCRRLSSGELSVDKLKKTIDAISPMLNLSQKEMLSNLLGKLNE